MHGGALIGFPNRDEAAAMGLTTDFVVISKTEFDAIDRVPREGLLFHERSTRERSGRFYYSAAGAVFEVAAPNNVRRLGLSASNAVPIPAFGLDSARRIPPTGTLLQQSGQDETWVIDGGGRRRAGNLCTDAHVAELPSGPKVLDPIPIVPDPPR
jgi:hypothetical protein